MFFSRKNDLEEYYDLHLHILPGMDDGAADVSVSMAMLKEQIRQGCSGLIATPHYYAEESIPDYLVRRQRAYDKLAFAIEEKMPEWEGRIGMGAEVAYNRYLASDPDLHNLCLQHSDYLLLEMPFSNWDARVLRDVQLMMNSQGVHIIIAHLERFPEYTSEESIQELLDMDVIVQMNAGALLHRSSKRRALQMVKNGITQVLGTDSHNMEERRPNMRDGLEVLEKAKLGDKAERILHLNEQIYTEAMRSER